jgi:DNA processing protein
MDLIYPPENTSLAREIAASGALISEYPLGVPAIPINFAARNRIISGLAKAVVVIEGAEKSGTLLTASHAANQGKTVLAVPGQITSPLSAAPLFLIKNGAKMAISTSDILEELDLSPTTNCEAFEKIIPSTKEEETFAKVLENEPLHLDEIARILSLDVAEVSARLTVMELKGLVKNMGRGVYKKL